MSLKFFRDTRAQRAVSVLTGIPVKKNVAMTGEVTLRGRVLPIGGLKEKSVAAHRYGIRHVIIPGALPNALVGLRIAIGVSVIMLVVSEQKFGISEYAGKWIVDFVTEDFSDIAPLPPKRRTRKTSCGRGCAQPVLHQAGGQREEIAFAGHEFDDALGDERRRFHLAAQGREQNERRSRGELAERSLQRSAA